MRVYPVYDSVRFHHEMPDGFIIKLKCVLPEQWKIRKLIDGKQHPLHDCHRIRLRIARNVISDLFEVFDCFR